ncbi:NAD-dependent epimerase/dehydratase family protein [Nocardia sp. NPDC055049]
MEALTTLFVDAAGPDSPASSVNYGDTKLTVDRAIASITRASELGAVSLRYFNVASAHTCGDVPMIGERHPPEPHLIPLALEAAGGLRDKFCLFGDDHPTPNGTCVRDYIHVTDLAHAHLPAHDAAGSCEHRIYSLGNGIGSPTSKSSTLSACETARVGTPLEADEGRLVRLDHRQDLPRDRCHDDRDRAHSPEDAARQLGHAGDAVTRRHYIDQPTQAPDFTATLERLKR